METSIVIPDFVDARIGPRGSLELLATLPGRRFYVHLNNTNPLLDAGAPEAHGVRKLGVEIASDGLELEL